MQKGASTLLERHEGRYNVEEPRRRAIGALRRWRRPRDKATGMKCERRSQLPQTTMDDKRDRETSENEGDNRVWFIQDLPMYTGGRGGITQGVSFEFFKSFLLIYSHNTHWGNFEFFQKLLTTLIKTYSLGNF